MEITEVKIILKEGPDKKLKAYATITFDNCFVIRNVKVIKGTRGLFVAMPSRKMKEACPKCNYKNAVRSRFCNQCGTGLPVPAPRDMQQEVKQSEHRDIAHPITLECREYIQKKVLASYAEELKNPALAENVSSQPQTSISKSMPEPVLKKETVVLEEKKPEESKPIDEAGDIQL